MIDKIIEFLKEQKCKDIQMYDLNGEKRVTKFIIVVTSPNFVENKKMAENMISYFKLESQPEGFNKGEWIVFDFDEIVVHSFIPTAREKYNLDKLWQNNRVNETKQSKKTKK